MKNSFLQLIQKESLHILRDKRTMLVVLLMPAVMLLLFGFAISTEVNNIKVAVVAPNRTDGVKDAVTRVDNNPYFSFCGFINTDDIDTKLRRGEVSAVVAFAPDYDRRTMQAATGIPVAPTVQIIVDASNTNTASATAVYLQNALAGATSPQAIFETHLLYNPQMKSAYNFVPGIMGVIFILVCAMMTSVSIVREKEMGTMEVLLVSPVKPIKIIIAKMLPYFFISCFTLFTILILSHYVVDVPMSGGIGGIIFVSLLYLTLALALGLLISTMAKSQIAAFLISAMVMMMPMIMLSGMLFPIENMPAVLQWLSCVVPARWYISAVRKMMIEGLPFAAVLHEFAVLCTMTVVLIGVSLKKFNDKLE